MQLRLPGRSQAHCQGINTDTFSLPPRHYAIPQQPSGTQNRSKLGSNWKLTKARKSKRKSMESHASHLPPVRSCLSEGRRILSPRLRIVLYYVANGRRREVGATRRRIESVESLDSRVNVKNASRSANLTQISEFTV